MAMITDATRTFINAKQRENEMLHDLSRRFKTSRDIMEAQLVRPIIVRKFINAMPEYMEYKERLVDQDGDLNS